MKCHPTKVTIIQGVLLDIRQIWTIHFNLIGENKFILKNRERKIIINEQVFLEFFKKIE